MLSFPLFGGIKYVACINSSVFSMDNKLGMYQIKVTIQNYDAY